MSVYYACYGPELDDPFQTFADVLEYLNSLGLFHLDLSLDRMERAVDALGIRRMPCPVIQVVGTNGKGSTSAMIQALAAAHGFRCGLFTSPHFVSPTERIRINQRKLPELAWARLASQVQARASDLTYFEMLTCLAMLSFKGTQADLIVLEAGLGGQYDATSALDRDLVCYTPIGLDHQNILGDTVEDIARDKAAAIQPKQAAVISAGQSETVLQILAERAKDTEVPFFTNTQALAASFPENTADWLKIADSADLGLAGHFQRENARTALAVWLSVCRTQGWITHENTIRKGLLQAFIPGRFQRVYRPGQPEIILDGAHNADGIAALAETMSREEIRPAAIIFSCLKDKDTLTLSRTVKELAGQAQIIVAAVPDNPRAMSGADLQALCGDRAIIAGKMSEALEMAGNKGPILICGSLYLLAEFFSLCPEALEASNPD